MIPSPPPPQTHCYCGVPEQALLGDRRLRKWDKRHLLWMIVDYIPTIDEVIQTTVYGAAFRQWSGVCGLTFAQTTDMGEADFLILTRNIDGAGGTLAEHQLPYGRDVQLRGWFDVGDNWSTGHPVAPSRIDLLAVATHEFGHGIGLGHIRPSGNLMNPTYDPAIRSPQPDDIAEAVYRYGEPAATPGTPGEPPTAADYPVSGMIEMASGAKYPLLVGNNSKWSDT